MEMTFVDAHLKVGARCSPTTRISVLSSHDCFAFNNCATVAAEDKVESFFEEEDEEDAGAKEGEEDAADNNTVEPAGNDGEVYAAGRCTGRRMSLG